MPSRSMSSIRRSGLHDRSSMSRKNWSPVMIVARQPSRGSSRGQRPPPYFDAQSSHAGGSTWVCRSMRRLMRPSWRCSWSAGAVADQLEEIAVWIQEVEALVIAPVDRGVVRDVAAGEQRRRGAVIVPRDLERVVALAERLGGLLEPARRAIRLEEQGAVALVVGEQDLVGEAHHDLHAQDFGVETLRTRQVGDVHAEVIEPPDPHAARIPRVGRRLETTY